MAYSKIEELIVTKSVLGSGTQSDPYREITEYFTKDGTLLFRLDTWEEKRSVLMGAELSQTFDTSN
jgi:hypothetical protein